MGVLKATGIVSTILALIVVAIALLKQLIAFIGFITFAIKAIIVLAFVALLLGVGLIIFRSWSGNKRQKDKD
jgi:hypothetical protein